MVTVPPAATIVARHHPPCHVVTVVTVVVTAVIALTAVTAVLAICGGAWRGVAGLTGGEGWDELWSA